jgi:hypothetical protein
MAVHMGKPVLLLYKDGDGPSLFINQHSDKVVCEKYDEYSLSEVIIDFIKYIKYIVV